MMQGGGWLESTVIVSAILTGGLVTVILKQMYETKVVLTDGSISTFSCPFFALLLNFVAVALLILMEMVFAWVRRTGYIEETEPDAEELSNYDILRYTFGLFNLGVSTITVISVLTGQAALVFLPATVYASLRQSNIPMTVAIRVYVFKKSLAVHQWYGVCILTIGLVGMAVVSHEGRNDLYSHGVMHMGLGTILLLASSIFLAGRYVFEEILMNDKRIPPLVVTGAQGVTGIIMSAILLVVAHYMGYEDFWKTSAMLKVSQQIQILVVAFVSLTVVYNASVSYATRMFDATAKAMVRGTKPIVVWALQLFWFYVIDSRSGAQHFGEPWVPPYSWLVLFAATFVSIGFVLYSFSYRSTPPRVQGETLPLIKK